MRLHDMIQLPDHDFYCGLLFVQGCGYRVGVVSDGQTHHMSAARARRLAAEYREDPEIAAELKPVSDALVVTADRLDSLGLPGQEPHGHA